LVVLFFYEVLDFLFRGLGGFYCILEVLHGALAIKVQVAIFGQICKEIWATYDFFIFGIRKPGFVSGSSFQNIIHQKASIGY
jgi:hypothetical protein